MGIVPRAALAVGLSLAVALMRPAPALADGDVLSRADMARAYLRKPLPSSHVVGSDPRGIFSAMNQHLERQPYHTQACEGFSHAALNQLARVLWQFRSPDLADVYTQVNDKRKLHFDTTEGDDGQSNTLT